MRAPNVAPELLPGVAALIVFVVWAAADGGVPATSMYPGALFLLGLVVVTAFAYGRAGTPMPSGLNRAALALLAGFAAWHGLSIIWADVPGAAWLGANRAFLYLTVFALFAIPRWRPSSAAVVLGAYSIAIAGLGVVILLKANGNADPTLWFIKGRLAEPGGYYNAVAALFLAASLPALSLAARPELPWPARATLLGAAGALAELAILPQSRGAVLGLAVALLVYFALVPARLRALLMLLPVALAVALAAPTLLDVYGAILGDGDPSGAVAAATRAVLLSAAGLFAAGALIALADRRLHISEGVVRVASRATAAAVAVVALIGVVLALISIGNPISWAGDRWDEFKSSAAPAEQSSRFTSVVGSNRYDFWRVAFDEFQRKPVLGVGADNFAVDYLRERRSEEEPFFAHSLPLERLAQTGIVGAGLLLGFLVTAAVAAIRAGHRSGPLGRATTAGALAGVAYWLAHGSVDWFWAFPALGAPAMAWLAMTARLEPAAEDPRDTSDPTVEGSDPTVEGSDPGGRGWRVGLGAVAGVAAALLAASYTLPWLAVRDVEVAAGSWRADAEGAFEALDRAEGLDPLSADAPIVAGTIAARIGDRERLRSSFSEALERDPNNWYALLELGTLDAVEGNRGQAVAKLRRAAELDPGDPLIKSQLRAVKAGRPVSFARLDQALLRRVCDRVGKTADTQFCD